LIDNGVSLDLEKLTEKDRLAIQEAQRYARYTYTVVTLRKDEVDKVNSCLLNEMPESLTFRSPARMMRSIRRWRANLFEGGFLPNILPPNIIPNLPRDLKTNFFNKSFEDYVADILANLPDFDDLLIDFKRLDELERQLKEELNRVHSDNTMQTGHISERRRGCWDIEVAEQKAKLSWRRSDRKKATDAIYTDGISTDGNAENAT